jgi:ABC-type uncharacterized transport system substrate-binding protein
MKRKITVFALCAMLLALCAPAAAQQPGKMVRIGFLDPSTPSGMAVLVEAFRQELSKLGWIEGKNITIEYRFAEQKTERLPELAAELVRLKVDIIVTRATTATLAAKRATTTIPIVMAAAAEPLINTHLKRIVEFAAKNRLPAMYAGPEFVDAGGLMSYAPSYTDLYRRAAVYVDKILKGAMPVDLPVEQPTKFELIINLKAAKQIGLTIPPNVLARADRVIK